MKFISGISVSKGISIGKAKLYKRSEIEIKEEKDSVKYKEKQNILNLGIKQTKSEIEKIYESLKVNNPKEAEIFQAQLLFLEDPILLKKINSLLKEGYTVAYSIRSSFYEVAGQMEKMKNIYFKERANDIKDVLERLLRNILKKPKTSLSNLAGQVIVVAKDLAPSDTANINRKNVLGLITEKKGVTSHTAILAEAFRIPAVVGVKGALRDIKDGMEIIIDGIDGKIITEPDNEIKDEYISRKNKLEQEELELKESSKTLTFTKSGRKIEVTANIGSPEDADIALEMGADGVGLYRTEFLFLGRSSSPSEEEQFEAYKVVLEKFNNRPVIIRTLDIGGDKKIPYLNFENDLNPFLGVRGIRVCLMRKDLFRTQLRAILRASNFGKARIMYPMIAVKDEVIEANNILVEMKKELEERKILFDKNIEVGIMVEIPSAALNAEVLSDYVDFLSIGTNDLTQYTFAADRTNDNLSYLYQPLDPSILKLIEITVEATHKKGKWAGVCGELAGDIKATKILVELGVDELSMSPQKIPHVKKIIKKL